MRSLKGKEYNDIKTLANMGVSKMELMRMFKRSRSAIGLVINTKDYSDYLDYRKHYHDKSKAVQTALPIKEPEKIPKDIREDIAIKLSALEASVQSYKDKHPIQSDKRRACMVALMRLEEARLWLKETF